MANQSPSQAQEGCRGCTGFTVVEVVVAIVLLSISVMSLSSFTFYSAQLVHRSKMTSLATMVAREGVDDARATAFDDLTVGSATDSVTMGTVILLATTVVSSVEANLKLVIVSVTEPSGRELQRFETHVHKAGS